MVQWFMKALVEVSKHRNTVFMLILEIDQSMMRYFICMETYNGLQNLIMYFMLKTSLSSEKNQSVQADGRERYLELIGLTCMLLYCEQFMQMSFQLVISTIKCALSHYIRLETYQQNLHQDNTHFHHNDGIKPHCYYMYNAVTRLHPTLPQNIMPVKQFLDKTEYCY